ncbi:RDD family [Snodgrassella alvi SCGC AB-598-J21]|uniref:RDD family n=1 Tax=Snodgrassella alvi SCGC AB-598-J21 TaxID=1385367 RepID=A0A074V8N8_9NEIS|nr:RDD family [Snodgrassella alvi SCGC AB-598-J21]
MGIRVIHLDNSSPDFWTNVIKRDIIYYLYLFFLVITIFYLPDLHNEDFWNFFLLTLLKLWSSVTTLPLLFIILLVNIFNLTCLYRLLSDKFLSITLQDKLAKTKVVQNISK